MPEKRTTFLWTETLPIIKDVAKEGHYTRRFDLTTRERKNTKSPYLERRIPRV
jgi:hypothetical protein